MKRPVKLAALFLALLLSLSACAGRPAVSDAPGFPSDVPEGGVLPAAEIRVFIAASLENAFLDIIDLYREKQPNITVTYNADSSGTLLTQLRVGGACDVFFSASTAQMDAAQAEGLTIDGTRVDLLRNEVVLITWKGSGTKVTGLANIGDAASIALADGSVPVGKYTRAALQALGVLDAGADPAAISTGEIAAALGGVEINECGNVSRVKEAVKEGANEVGTVYYSDAWSVRDDVDIIERVSPDLTGAIVYPMVRTVNREADPGQTAAADDFFAFLQTPEVISIFEEYMLVYNLD